MIRELEHITYKKKLREQGWFALENRRKEPKETFYCCLLQWEGIEKLEPDSSWRNILIQREAMDTSCRAECYTRPEQVPSNLNYSTIGVTSLS